jgi:succinate-acetate transporter protein
VWPIQIIIRAINGSIDDDVLLAKYLYSDEIPFYNLTIKIKLIMEFDMMGNVTETKIRLADPAALGVFGLSMATLVAASAKLGLTGGTGGILPWVIFLGAFAQIIACSVEFKRENVFAATAFGAFGLFWFAIGMTWLLPVWGIAFDANQLGFAFIGYLIFCLFMTYAAASINKSFFAVFFFIDFLFIFLIMQTFFGTPGWLAGVAELLVSAAGFYTTAAVGLKGIAGFEVIPLGNPILKMKKLEL